MTASPILRPPGASQPQHTSRSGRVTGFSLLTLLFALLILPGCSFVFMRPPPPSPLWQRVRRPNCTRSRAWPIVDTIMTLTLGAQALSDSLDTSFATPGRQTNSNALTSVLVAAAYGASAWVGYDRADRCSELVYYLNRWRGSGGQRGRFGETRPYGPRGPSNPRGPAPRYGQQPVAPPAAPQPALPPAGPYPPAATPR